MGSGLLDWTQIGDTYFTYSPLAAAYVYPCNTGYCWGIFIGEDLLWFGHQPTLHSALSHVEGNYVARKLRPQDAVDHYYQEQDEQRLRKHAS